MLALIKSSRRLFLGLLRLCCLVHQLGRSQSRCIPSCSDYSRYGLRDPPTLPPITALPNGMYDIWSAAGGTQPIGTSRCPTWRGRRVAIGPRRAGDCSACVCTCLARCWVPIGPRPREVRPVSALCQCTNCWTVRLREDGAILLRAQLVTGECVLDGWRLVVIVPGLAHLQGLTMRQGSINAALDSNS